MLCLPLGLVSDEAVDKSFEREREVAEQDQALMDTTAGKVGYGVGLIGTTVTPGVVLKGAGLAAKGAGLMATGAALDTAGTAVAPQSLQRRNGFRCYARRITTIRLIRR